MSLIDRRTELQAWLGPALDELDEDQRDRIVRESDRIDERYPGPDDTDDREAALSAAVQYLLGETTIDEARATLDRARGDERRAFVAAVQIATMAVHDGTPKATAARAAGLNRMTLLEALGERVRDTRAT
jgi:hypothetical protein